MTSTDAFLTPCVSGGHARWSWKTSPACFRCAAINYAALAEEELAAEGYRVGYAQLNAVWYGVPQFRERLFFIGIREDLGIRPAAPLGTHRVKLPEGYRRPLLSRRGRFRSGPSGSGLRVSSRFEFSPDAEPAVTVREALDDLPAISEHLEGNSLPRGDFRRMVAYRHAPQSAFSQLMRAWPGLPFLMAFRTTSLAARRGIMRRFGGCGLATAIRRRLLSPDADGNEEVERLKKLGEAPEPDTTEWRQLEERFIPPYPLGSFEDRWRKLIPDQPSWTVPAHLARRLVLAHPPRQRAGADDLGPRGGPPPVVPRRVPLRREHGRLLPPDRQRGAAAAGAGRSPGRLLLGFWVSRQP